MHKYQYPVDPIDLCYIYGVSLQRLPYFVAVANHGSFVGAAKALHLTQPSLSNQIHALEREIGVELFHRTARGASLTAAGVALLPEARLVLERFGQATMLARRVGLGEAGRLAIGLVPTVANGRLPVFIRRFMAEYPEVDLSLVEQRPAELVEQLRSGALDVVIQYQPVGHDVVDIRIASERLVLAVPSGHPLALQTAASVTDLNGMPLILPAAHGSAGILPRLRLLLEEHGVEPEVVQTDIWLMQTIVGLVSAGVGFAIVPESAAVIRADQVSFLPLTDQGATVDLYANHHAENYESTVRRFVTVLTDSQPD